MTDVMFDKDSDYQPQAYGRNGMMQCHGLSIVKIDWDGVLYISPINSKGVGKCRIEIPVNSLFNVIDVLRHEYFRSSRDYWTGCENYPVEDWINEVRSKNTRLGYWEWVDNQKRAEES